jgi:hypothetical protein
MTFTWELIAVAALLLGVVWYKQHQDRKEAYREGATHGFILGIDRTIGMMVDQQMIKRRAREPVQTKDDLMIKMAPLIAESVIKDAERLLDKNSGA